MNIKPPIMIYDNGDFLFFSSVEDMISFLEPDFTDTNDLIVYDSEENLLHFTTQEEKGFKKIVFSGITPEPKNKPEVRSLLAEYFAKKTGEMRFLNSDWNTLVEEIRKNLSKKRKGLFA